MVKITFIIPLILIVITKNKCAYKVDETGRPIKLKQGLQSCKQYNGKIGCCNQNNDKQQKGSYIEIDSIFGFKGRGCDHCAINLKRFWCEYACSPDQAEFINITDENETMPDPQNPDKNISVQKLIATVQAQTACDLYNSCKRIGFVTSVSAMGSPAGFLTFQGHNAVDQAFQYIDVQFSYNKNNSLSFSDSSEESEGKSLSTCNTKVSGQSWHKFKFNENCKCNTCEEACDNSNGFVYTQSSVFQGFNWALVGGTYLLFGLIAGGVTFKRMKGQKNKQN